MKKIIAGLVCASVAVAIIGSSASATTALPTDAGVKVPDSVNVFLGSGNDNSNQMRNCTYKVGDYIACNPDYSTTAGNFTVSGFDINFSTFIPANSYSTFIVEFHTNDYQEREFNGFVANQQYEDLGAIVDQKILQYDGKMTVVQITMFNEVATKRLSVRSADGKGVVFIGASANNKVNFVFTSVSWVAALSGNTLMNGINDTNNKLDQILNNGITANTDNSDVVNQLEEQKKQQHEDAMAQLNWEKEQAQKEENEANKNADTQVDTGVGMTEEGAKNSFNLFTTILTTPAGNCTLPEISAHGFSLGEINLCTYSPPAWLRQVMGAVVAIAMASGLIKATTRVLEELGRAY